MSLVACPTCANEVSSQAAICPKCGHPLKSADSVADYSFVVIAGSIILVLLLVFMLMQAKIF
jgi:uncharacterized paraquat-inducible protein A